MNKELYFTTTSIHLKAQEILASIESFRRGHDAVHFHPEVAALLVLDMQAYFLRDSSHAFIPSAVGIIPGIQALIHAFATHQRPVIFTRHSNIPADAGQMALWWKDLLEPDTPDSEIIPELDTTTGVMLVKHQYDAFYGTELEEMLRADGVREVVITGVMTHICCETTARSAFMRGFKVLFTIDGTATYTEAFHRASILNLAHGFAVPVMTEEILAEFQ
jgi:isochorismate hydrolase